ncbi:hypothetical protein FRC19_009227 [Serendipita sp. 401]|nr:hypothetical protein FRC15_011741 [Serendipita sp. 397]KAG8828143.1 hypothetical protein FRC19_009227 [Serendipita sp. 401]KAG8863927.1 hypothetical protein FRC20_010435 [Serendipita sp. 405]KAG9058449.1 hypothetical protein FS842_009517 [Serendipita sp. 407]
MSTTTAPEQQIVNISDEFRDQTQFKTINISDIYKFERIDARLYHLPTNYDMELSVPPEMNQICYIISGEGEIKKGGESAKLGAADSFSFLGEKYDTLYSLVTKGETMDVLIITDVQKREEEATTGNKPSGIPTIVNSAAVGEWKWSGIATTKVARLVSLTDMKVLRKQHWGFNLGRIPPGTQSSNAHAHSHEDEFAIILEGTARYWHQGESPEHILKRGDIVGWKAGTGVCHALLNDALDEGGSGQDLVFIVWGEDRPDDDLVHYAAANPPWWKDEIKWVNRPVYTQGPAPAMPRFPRPEDRAYPDQ